MNEEIETLKKKISELEKEIYVLRTNLDIELSLRYVAENRLMQWEKYIQDCVSKANE